MTDELAGQVIVVTGCAQGIGRAICGAAAGLGMKVVGLDIDVAGGLKTVAMARDIGAEAWFHECDVSDPVAIEEAFSEIHRTAGPTDVLVNNAAFGIHAPPEDLTFQDWQKVIGVSLTGPALAAQQAGRSMIAAGNGGSIVNMTSIAGLAALGRGNFSYSVAKAGLIGLTKELAIEWAGYGIRVNAIAPSQVHTEGFRTLIGDEKIEGGAILEKAVRGIPLGRLAEASDIVAAVLFLISQASSFITGVVLPVDGGSLAFHPGGSLRDRKDLDS